MFAMKYSEDFVQAGVFVEAVWGMLAGVSDQRRDDQVSCVRIPYHGHKLTSSLSRARCDTSLSLSKWAATAMAALVNIARGCTVLWFC